MAASPLYMYSMYSSAGAAPVRRQGAAYEFCPVTARDVRAGVNARASHHSSARADGAATVNQLTATGSPRSCLLAKSFTLNPFRSDESTFESCDTQTESGSAAQRLCLSQVACKIRRHRCSRTISSCCG